MTEDRHPSMAGKTVLITGATGGIGKATAIGLTRLGAHVGIVGRDATRAEAAAADIRSAVSASTTAWVTIGTSWKPDFRSRVVIPMR